MGTQLVTQGIRAGKVEDYLRSLSGQWEYPEDTVDTFKVGGRDTVVTGIAVAWLPFNWAVERAHELGCSLFVTHEPTFYDHRDSRTDLFDLDVPAQRLRRFEELGMAVLRCHDLWDRHPGDGITTSWGDFLGLDNLVGQTEYARLYQVEATTARQFASRVAETTSAMGQEAVQLIGDGDREVKTVCIGTGAISPYLELVRELGPDLVICSDDGLDFWRDGAFAVDGGPPIVVVHHGVAEEPGVARLAAELAAAFPDLPVHHIEQRAMYELVSPPEGQAGSTGTTGKKSDG